MTWVLAQSWAMPAMAQEKVLTPELILGIRQAADAQISPDGSRVMVQVSRPRTVDEKVGSAVPELWLVPSTGGEPVRFTSNDEGDRAARWSPDGRAIAFLSRRPGNEFQQVYLLPVGGGEAHRLTSAENTVRSFKWSPDGKSIAYTVTDPNDGVVREVPEVGMTSG
jgi:dipeptidyl aminopeptidase/acylaminoacyl peptidase